MKRLISIIMCFFILTGCTDENIEDTSSQSTESSSSAVVEVQLSDEEMVESMFDKLVKGNLALKVWDNTQQLNTEDLYFFFSYLFSPRDYVRADIYEDYTTGLFGVSSDTLRQCKYYMENQQTYNFHGRYIHGNNSAEIMEYHVEGNIISVDYIIYNPLDIPRYRTMTFARNGNIGQYISNVQNTLYSYNPEVQPVSLKQENLLLHAEALAEHLVEMKGGNYRLSDLKPENILWVIRTVFMFGYDDFSRGNNVQYYPYNKYLKYNGGDAVYTLKQAQIIAYQLFGFENWFVDDEIFDKEINRYVQPTELGFGFGPVARNISSMYISDNIIQVNIYAENLESEEKYNFAVYFDVMSENGCTFLRFNEMTMQKL